MFKLNNIKYVFLKYFLWTIPFLGFFFGYCGLSLGWQKKEIVVPNIRGNKLQDASRILASKSLSLRLLREQEDSDLPEGIILQQVPLPKKFVRPNQTIFVTVSKQPPIIVSPMFIGDKYGDIVFIAKKNGIKLQLVWIKSIFPFETCIAQYPAPGCSLVKNKMILYLSGEDKNLFIVPNFKGAKLEEVESSLREHELKWEVISFNKKLNLNKKSKTLTLNVSSDLKIVDQKPMPGSIIDISNLFQFQLQVE